MVEKDVREARAHMDLTQWQMYDENKKSESLSAIGSAVRNRVMPPRRYIVLHPEARLTDEEIDQVYRWTRDERRRSRQSAPGN
jgi:cytochrome c